MTSCHTYYQFFKLNVIVSILFVCVCYDTVNIFLGMVNARNNGWMDGWLGRLTLGK